MGEFADWILGTIGPQPLPVHLVDARRDPLPDPLASDVVITTGSSGSVYDREPWSERAGEWLLAAAGTGAAVLGICYGHQLLAQALGGRVARNPGGPELGTVQVERTVPDPLLDGLGERFFVQQAHFDAVVEAPPGAVVLAANTHTPIQALALGPRVRAVQWHPEFSARAAGGYVQAYRTAIGDGAADLALRAVHDPPGRGRPLSNFLRHFGGVEIGGAAGAWP